MPSLTVRVLRAATAIVALVTAAWSASVWARHGANSQGGPLTRLAEYEGQYEYRDDGTLFIVADGTRLVAILGDGKYPMRASGADAFVNVSGEIIPFVRDRSGHVVAFKERGVTFARLSPDVPAGVRALLEARARRPDGRPDTYIYRAPPDLSDGIATGAAGPGTLSTSVAEQLVNGVVEGTYPDVRAIAVHHKGALRLEEYFYGYDRNRPHPMRSLTKSVIALLAGIVVDRGLLPADEPVLARLGFPAYEHPDPRKARVTLRHLLSNQSGLACDDHDGASPGNETKIYETADWVKAFVDLPLVADPGTEGRYCSAGFITAARLIERATGMDVPAFANDVLFEPLGVRPAQWKWTFRPNRSQRHEFGQIYLRPRDMLKLGLLLQQRGLWEGRRLVSANWVDAVVSRQSRVDDSDYGLGVWHRWYRVDTPAGPRRVDTIMLSGNGGQKVYLVPSLELIAVFTGGAFNAASPANAMMARVLLPALIAEQESVEARQDGDRPAAHPAS